MAAEPWARNMDELRNSTWMNYSNIDPYWIEKGFNEDNLVYLYPRLNNSITVIAVVMFVGYVLMHRTRKKISLKKQLGEEPLTYWETFSEGTKLGTEPAINFISSCLVTNDRIFIIIRLVMAFWSLTLTILGFAGIRSIVFGSYFPLATIITIYVSRHRHLIVEGFGNKMQILNKFLSFFFCLQAPLRLMMGIAWWTGWLWTSRYKDMRKSSPSSRGVLWQTEFLPCVFLLIEILWFDTRMSCISAYHVTFTLSAVIVNIVGNCLKENGGTDNPQITIWVKENPGAGFIQVIIHLVLLPGCVLLIAGFCNLKIWAFKRTPVIKERLEIRQNCIAIFRKRHALNKFLPEETLKNRKTNARESYATIGRQTTLRKTRMTKMGNA